MGFGAGEVTGKYLGTLAEVLSDDGRRGGLPGQFSLVGHDTPPAHKGSSQQVALPPTQALHLPPWDLTTILTSSVSPLCWLVYRCYTNKSLWLH